MKRITWQITENNGGGLTLYIWKGKRLVYAHTGYEYSSPKQLLEDIKSLQKGGDPTRDKWEGNDLIDEELIREIRQTYDEQTGKTYPSDDEEVYDKNRNIISLTHDEYYDDHWSTKVIADQDGIVEKEGMGNAGRRVFYP